MPLLERAREPRSASVVAEIGKKPKSQERQKREITDTVPVGAPAEGLRPGNIRPFPQKKE